MLRHVSPLFIRLDTGEKVPDDVEEAAARTGAGGSTWRFVHLTFQEFFVARRLVTLLEAEVDGFRVFAAKRAAPLFRSLLEERLGDAFWREVLLLLASSCADLCFSALIDFLLAGMDAELKTGLQGVNDHLVLIMLDERREHPESEAKLLLLRQMQADRLLKSAASAMSHPWQEIRSKTVHQMENLDIPLDRISTLLISSLDKQKPWFDLCSSMTALIEVREAFGLYDADSHTNNPHVAAEAGDVALADAIAKGLLTHRDLDVQRAAARGLGAVGVRNDAIVFALLETLDGGDYYVQGEVAQTLVALGMSWADIAKELTTRMARK